MFFFLLYFINTITNNDEKFLQTVCKIADTDVIISTGGGEVLSGWGALPTPRTHTALCTEQFRNQQLLYMKSA